MKDNDNTKRLYSRYLDDLYTKDDAQKVLRELSNTENRELFEELAETVWKESISLSASTQAEHETYKKEAHRLLERIEHKKRTWFRRISRIAISTVAGVCLVLGSIYYINQRNEQQISYLEASTSYGECKQVLLPDGTQITLNSCSSVRYPHKFTGEERKVELEGEGYFKVYRNEEQPFIIKTHRLNIRVLGTCFNVKSYTSDEVVSVEVESGKVQVDLPDAMVRLQAKEQISFNTVSEEFSKRQEERPIAIWQKGGLRFNSTPVRDVAKELERMYNCRISFTEGQEFKNLISGEHDNKSLEAVLQSIEYTSGIRFKKDGNQIQLYK